MRYCISVIDAYFHVFHKGEIRFQTIGLLASGVTLATSGVVFLLCEIRGKK